MRLLSTTESDEGLFTMKEFSGDSIPEYAILSHTWGNQEVTYQDLLNGGHSIVSTDGYRKIQRCCHVARQANISWAWVDTCCIDKTSSAELTKAINSMYRWYQRAKVCYAFLSDVPTKPFEQSRWFTRGWTLQELIAPRDMIFFDDQWQKIGTKSSLNSEIADWTGIPTGILSGIAPLDYISVAQRMSWASKRQTSRVEDRAYSLLGIFDINMPLIYGEEEKAFIRLQEEIIRTLEDYTIFAWRAVEQPAASGGLLAPSPDAFANSSNIILTGYQMFSSMSTWSLSNRGLQLELPFMGIGPQRLGLAVLDCSPVSEHDLLLAIYLRDVSGDMTRFERVFCETWELIEPTWLPRPVFSRRRICVPQRPLPWAKSTFSERYSHFNEATGSAFERFKGMKFDRFDCFEAGCTEQSSNTRLKYDALIHSARDGDLATVRHLIVEHKLGDRMKRSVGWFALLAAASARHTAVVWFLMSMTEVDINKEFEDPDIDHICTLLSVAVTNGDNDLAWLLLSRSDIQTDFGELAPPPVKLALKYKRHDIFWMLMTHKGFSKAISRDIDELKSDCIEFTDRWFYEVLVNKLDFPIE